MNSSAVATASDIQMDYMNLLVAQLQNQNPLDPLDNKDMSSQLAQFSQLQQLEGMNSSFAKVLDSVRRSYATSLIGKEVSFGVETSTGESELSSGSVDQVYNGIDGEVFLVVGSNAVSLEDILIVKD
jgi:flagellar basal-body rod modification protein FlgD